MTPFEALYGRKCRSSLYWDEVGESTIIGPQMIVDMVDKGVVCFLPFPHSPSSLLCPRLAPPPPHFHSPSLAILPLPPSLSLVQPLCPYFPCHPDFSSPVVPPLLPPVILAVAVAVDLVVAVGLAVAALADLSPLPSPSTFITLAAFRLKRCLVRAYYSDICISSIACHLEKREAGAIRVYIMTLGVLAPYRGLGIGTKLLSHVLNLCLK
ncbi:hypothetical protein ACLOJK_022819 [Asimina triloba]